MDFLELAAKRYSVRKFTGERVKQDDIDRILKAGWLAPTACNASAAEDTGHKQR